MVDFYNTIDFSSEIARDPELEAHIKSVCDEFTEQYKTNPDYAPPTFDKGFNHVVILAGLPPVPMDKVEKFHNFLLVNFKKLEISDPLNFRYEAKGSNTSGVLLLEFADAETAKNAVEKLNGYPIDKSHDIVACTNEEFDQIMKMETKYKAPNVILDDALQGWLADARLREQYLVKAGDQFHLEWFDHVDKKAINVFSQKNFQGYGPVTKASWSRNGSYLVTIHDKGFGLWGGANFDLLAFFNHTRVKQVEFSHDENYLLSFNGTVAETGTSENIIVWKTLTSQKLRSFKADSPDSINSYKWSFDSRYLATCGNNLLNIYELPTMQKIVDASSGKRSSIGIPNIQQIEWAPSRNIICIAAYPSQTQPSNKNDNWGKIFMLELTRDESTGQVSRKDLKWKTITWEFNSVKIYWEPTSLRAVLVFNKLKGKKGTTVIQIGELGSQSISIEEHEFNDVKCVNIDEEAKKIAIIIPDSSQVNVQSGTLRYNVDIYRIDEQSKGKVLQKVGTLTDRTLSHVLWAVNGTFLALVNTDKLSANIGYLEFAFLKANNKGELGVEAIKNHKVPYMIYAAWDPSGKSLITQTEKGHYNVWNALGEVIHKDNFSVLNTVNWRPKPKIILPADITSRISKEFKQITQKYENEDDKIINEEKYKELARRKEQSDKFVAYLQERRTKWDKYRDQRKKLLGFDEENLEDVVLDEIIESRDLVELKK